jgi:isoleucyl-tRNA synthetase
VVCIGSIQELKDLTGRDDITDLHRENVDKLTIPSKLGKGVLRRVPEVFDCWFESGSMPYAQAHFPFENKKEFEDGFPGDFIAEGIDQTRGWFYTLLVLSTALFGKAPFKNLICHGLVLAADGQKMSKRKKNYPDPLDVVHSYGADAIRLYLVNSPVVRADNLRFKEEGVRDILKDVFLPWFNAYRFLMQNITRLELEEGHEFEFAEVVAAENYMDRWIISFTQTLIQFVKEEMAAYRLYTVVPRLVKFVEQLTNWYVRMNRKRLKGEGGLEDCDRAVHTLFGVLFSMTKVMAPFIPFLTEHMYQNMKNVIKSKQKDTETASVHFLMLPESNPELIDANIELAVSRMQTVIELGRVVRERNTMPMKYPLSEVVVIHRQEAVLDDVRALERYVQEELNVRTVTVSQDKVKYGVRLQATPDFKALGARLKGDLKKVMAALKDVSDSDLEAFQKSGALDVCGHTLGPDDLKLSYTAKNESGSSYEAHSDGDMLILLDVTPDRSMLDEGLAREVINRVQKLRKKAKLTPHDDITVYFSAAGDLPRIVAELHDFIQVTVKQPMVSGSPPRGADVIISEASKIKDDTLELTFVRGHQKVEERVTMPAMPAGGVPPACAYINVIMHTQQGTLTDIDHNNFISHLE